MPAVWASGAGTVRGGLRFPRYTLRPATEWIACAVPALVSDELWQAAQERLAMQTRFAPRNSQHTYVLRGLLVCSVCGHTLQGRTQRGVGYYTCVYGGKQRPPDVPPHTRWLRRDLVEPLIWQAFADLLREPQRISDAWAASADHTGGHRTGRPAATPAPAATAAAAGCLPGRTAAPWTN